MMTRLWHALAVWCLNGSPYVVTTYEAIDEIAQVAAHFARVRESDRFDREWLALIQELGASLEPALRKRPREVRH